MHVSRCFSTVALSIRGKIHSFRVLRDRVGWLNALRLGTSKLILRFFDSHASLHYSQTGEDLILSHYVDKYLDRREFRFLDIGCHDARTISSTYLHYLRGANGVNVDLNPIHSRSFARHRPRDRFLRAAVSDSCGTVRLHRFASTAVDTIDEKTAEEWAQYWKPIGTEEIATCTASALLRGHGIDVASIEVLLLDVEGSELAVLKGFDWSLFRPKLIVLELHNLDLTRASENVVVSYLMQFGYSLTAYATLNAYFVLSSR
jgi:FkbM family methyltransferase